MIIVLMQETRIDMRGTPSSVCLGLSGILIARSRETIAIEVIKVD